MSKDYGEMLVAVVVGELVAEELNEDDDDELDADELDADELDADELDADEFDDEEFEFEDDDEFWLRNLASGGRLVCCGEPCGVISALVLSGSDRTIAKLHGLGVGGEEVFDFEGEGEKAVAMMAVSVP